MKLLFGTSNKHKIHEVKEIIARHHINIEIVSLNDMEVKYPEPIETGKTFLENAIIKAKYYYEKYSMPVISDDSGLVVDALKGLPGVFSARFASTHTHNATSKDNRVKLLTELGSCKNRNAHFVCSIVYYDGAHIVSESGIVDGVITYEEIGSNGFGYDSLFFIPSLNKTMAEISEDEKNVLSHRGKAVNNLLDILTKKHIILS